MRRAERISPTRSALDCRLPFTLHNDSPVVPPDMMRTRWSATTRRTRINGILGPAQRLTTAEALAALTIDPERLQDVVVVETLSRGRVVYRRP